MPVHDLVGTDRPFFRLATFLADGKFEAAAIDAPFSLPQAHLPPDGHGELLHQVRLLPNGPGRDFPEASSLINLGERYSRKTKLKPLGLTEQYWARRGISIRSTMWAKPRGGAPFTAACLRLLDLARRPIRPWADAHQTGMLVEAFPAAQLHEWGLPHQGYPAPFADRERIIRFLRQPRECLFLC